MPFAADASPGGLQIQPLVQVGYENDQQWKAGVFVFLLHLVCEKPTLNASTDKLLVHVLQLRRYRRAESE